MTDQQEHRRQLLHKAGELLAEAATTLAELASTYPEAQASACHPRQGFTSTRKQIERLRKALKAGRV